METTNDDTLTMIFVWLADADLVSFKRTCMSFRDISHNDHAWRQRIINVFGADIMGFLSSGETYQQAYENLTFNQSIIDPREQDAFYTFDGAGRHGYIPIIRTILDTGKIDLHIDLEVFDKMDYCEVFYDIAKARRWNVLTLLYDKYGLDIDFMETDIMYFLAKDGDIEGFKEWMLKGINLKEPGSTALYVASDQGNDELVQFLLNNGANPNYREYVERWPPLINAVKYCSIPTIKLMIECGADIHYCDDMIFGEDIWDGFDMLDASPKRPEVIEYLSTL
jgi:hypothetical protein